MSNLRRQLWRYRAGLLDVEHVRASFDDELNASLAKYSQDRTYFHWSMDPNSPEYSLCREFDNAIDSARQAVRTPDFALAECCLQHAKATLDALQLTTGSRQYLAAARATYVALLQLIGDGPERSFTTPETVRRLLSKAEELFQNRKVHQARFIASMCAREAQRLTTVQKDFPELEQMLGARFLKLKSLDENLTHIRWAALGLPIEPTVTRLEALCRQRRLVLTERLLDDFEFLVGPQFAFVGELSRQLGNLATVGPDRIHLLLSERGVLAANSWNVATERLLNGALATLSNDINAIQGKPTALSQAPKPKTAAATAVAKS